MSFEDAPTFYLVVPCYNEEEVLPETSRRLRRKFDDLISSQVIGSQSKVLFVDDGSDDATWELVEQLHGQDDLFSGLKLSRNRGHQNALIAGMLYAGDRSDYIGSMDADLQDDIDALDEMIEKARNGFDVVYGVRNNRATDSIFKRGTAQAFYRLQSRLGVESVYNHADYRVMSSRAVRALSAFKETNLFIRGLVPLVGFKSCTVYYSRSERFAGESKYGLKKMLAFAIDGITSFSIKPIKLISITGCVIFLVSLLALVYIIVGHYLGNLQVGWASMMVSIWCLGGLQLFAIGVIGEYVGKTYLESKARPRYVIERVLDGDKETETQD